jgi:hypothetical protein
MIICAKLTPRSDEHGVGGKETRPQKEATARGDCRAAGRGVYEAEDNLLENLSAQRTLSEHAWPASIVAFLLGETKSDSRPQSPAKDWEPK